MEKSGRFSLDDGDPTPIHEQHTENLQDIDVSVFDREKSDTFSLLTFFVTFLVWIA